MKISGIRNLGCAGMLAGGLATGMSACNNNQDAAFVEGIITEVRTSDSTRFANKIDSVSKYWAGRTNTLLEDKRASVLDSMGNLPKAQSTINIYWKRPDIPTDYIDFISQKSFESGIEAGRIMRAYERMDDSLKKSSMPTPDSSANRVKKAMVEVFEVASDTLSSLSQKNTLKEVITKAIADTSKHLK